jgi:hypothetical protein
MQRNGVNSIVGCDGRKSHWEIWDCCLSMRGWMVEVGARRIFHRHRHDVGDWACIVNLVITDGFVLWVKIGGEGIV